MSTYYDNFSYSNGELPTVSSAAWTRVVTNGDWSYSVVDLAAASDGKALRIGATSSGDNLNIVRWDTVPSETGRIEILTRGKFAGAWAANANDFSLLPALIADNNASYLVSRSSTGNTLLLARRGLTGGTAQTIQSVSFTDLAADTWFWLRMERTGSTVRARVWTGAIGDEPTAGWTMTGTDPSPLTGLRPGFLIYVGYVYQRDPAYFDFMSCGTGTDAAPSSPAGPPDTTDAPYLIVPRRQLFVSRRVIQH